MAQPSHPSRIGPYEVTGLLGKGGMGAVYRARHPEMGVERALKVLLRPDEPTAAARFDREARALAAVRHPAVVGVHEVGVEPDPRGGAGLLYLAMDLVEGESLERILTRGGRLEVARALELVAEAAEGVAALHAAGIVHRDLKPDNVVVTPTGHAVVIDLGLAKTDDAERLTRSGAVTGTMGYLAPEQLEGRATPRTDVHALGLILHEALTGAPAILAGDSNQAVLAAILSDSRPRPGSLRPDLPAAVDEVVARATARDPEERFADAGELASALRALAGATSGPTVRQLRARRLALRALSLLAAGVVVAAVLVQALTPPVAPTQPPVARPPSTRRVQDEETAEARRALDRARRLDGAAKASALQAWLARWPDRPEAEEARGLARQALRSSPRWLLVNPRAFLATFAGERDDVMTVDLDGVVRVRTAGELKPRLECPLGADITSAATPPDGRLLLGTATNELHAFDPEVGTFALFARTRQSARLALSLDRKLIAVAAGNGVALCTPHDGVALRHIVHESPVVAIAFEPGGLLLTGSGQNMTAGLEGDNALCGWDPATGEQRFRVETLTRCNAIVVVPGPARGEVRRAIAGTNGGTLSVVDIAKGEVMARLVRESGAQDAMLGGTQALHTGVSAMCCSADGRVLYVISDDTDLTRLELVAWDLTTGHELRRITGRPFRGKYIALSRDGRTLLVGGIDAVELWDVDALLSPER